MTSFAKIAGLVGILVAAFTVTPELKADQLTNAVREGQAVTTKLGPNASAITYWASGSSEGWCVVTTVDTVIEQNGDAEKHAVVRFSAVLPPGQSQLISVPFPIGEQQPVLRIRRVGDQIEVARVGGSYF
jgi:hypothetical protein